MAVAGVASFEPCRVGLIQAFYSTPVEERPGIEENDSERAHTDDKRKIDIVPSLFRRPRVRERIKPVRQK